MLMEIVGVDKKNRMYTMNVVKHFMGLDSLVGHKKEHGNEHLFVQTAIQYLLLKTIWTNI